MPSARLLAALLVLTPLATRAQQNIALTSRSDAVCSNDANELRRAALLGIMQIEPVQVLPAIERLLEKRDECSVPLRRQAIELLSRSREPERVEVMLRAARTDPSSVVRRQAVQSLAQVNNDRSGAALDSILLAANDADLAESALRGLSQLGTSSARGTLRRVAESTSMPVEIRAKAVSAIASGRATQEDMQYLRDLYGKTNGLQLREAIVRSVSYQRNSETMAWLLGIARNSSQETELRQAALRSATQSAGWNGAVTMEIKDIVALYDEFAKQPEMQDLLMGVIAQRPESAATDKLLQIASDSDNVTLRRKAVQRLGQRRDPRVRQFLLDLVAR